MLVHLITSIESGGAQRVLYEYLKSSHGKQEQVVFYLKGPPFFKALFNELGVKVYKVNSFSKMVRFMSVVRKALFVKSWMYHACVSSALLKLINPKLNISWSIHHGQVEKGDSFSTRLFSKIAAHLSYIVPSAVIYPSEFCKKMHVADGYSKNNTRVIYNPVNYGELITIGGKKSFHGEYIGFCGRNHPNKRYNLFLESAIEFCRENEFVKFIVCGDGTDNVETLKRIKDKKLNARFVFLGEVEDTSSFYRSVDVYTSLSSTESFGLTMIEAYAANCALVCTDIEAYREILKDTPVFVLVPSVDSVIIAWKKALACPPKGVDAVFLEQFSVKTFYKRYSDAIYKRS